MLTLNQGCVPLITSYLEREISLIYTVGQTGNIALEIGKGLAQSQVLGLTYRNKWLWLQIFQAFLNLYMNCFIFFQSWQLAIWPIKPIRNSSHGACTLGKSSWADGPQCKRGWLMSMWT